MNDCQEKYYFLRKLSRDLTHADSCDLKDNNGSKNNDVKRDTEKQDMVVKLNSSKNNSNGC